MGCPYKPVEVLKINELHQYGMTGRVGSLSGIALDFPRSLCNAAHQKSVPPSVCRDNQ